MPIKEINPTHLSYMVEVSFICNECGRPYAYYIDALECENRCFDKSKKADKQYAIKNGFK